MAAINLACVIKGVPIDLIFGQTTNYGISSQIILNASVSYMFAMVPLMPERLKNSSMNSNDVTSLYLIG